jgi:hypothetical protein
MFLTLGNTMSITQKENSQFPELPTPQQKIRRQRPPPVPKQNLLYDKIEISSFNEIDIALNETGIKLPNPTEENCSLAMKVAESFSQIPSVSPAQIRKNQDQMHHELGEMDAEIERLSEHVKSFEDQLNAVTAQLTILLQKRDEKTDQLGKKPLNMVLRDLGEAILLSAPQATIKNIFLSLPLRIQHIVSTVPNLIPQEKSHSLQAQTHVSQVVPDTMLPSKSRSMQYSQAEKLVFGCMAFVQHSSHTGTLGLLSHHEEIISAIEKLQDVDHDIMRGIVIQTCVSDNLTSHPSLTLYDERNVRHARKPSGVVQIIAIYHQDNEEIVLKNVTTKYASGNWDSEEDREILKRLTLIRRNPFGN